MDAGSSGLSLVSPPFERENAKLLPVISLSPYFKSTKALSLPLVEIRWIRSGTTRSTNTLPHLPFGFKPTIILSNAMMCPDMTHFLHIPFRLFLLSFRTHPDCPHSPSSKLIFPTVLPSVIKVQRYSECLLKLQNQSPRTATIPKTWYSHFILLS